MSKIEGLVRRIVRLRQTAPEEKSLVFSQYPDALKLVGKALSVNNIAWVELKGGSKVSSLVLSLLNQASQSHAITAECSLLKSSCMCSTASMHSLPSSILHVQPRCSIACLLLQHIMHQ